MDVLLDVVADNPARASPTATDASSGAKGPTASPTPPRPSRLVAVDVRCHETIIGAPAQDLLTRRG